jgi:hypothetical protein
VWRRLCFGRFDGSIAAFQFVVNQVSIIFRDFLQANSNPDRQNLFAIIQGGLDPALRVVCVEGLSACVYVRVG